MPGFWSWLHEWSARWHDTAEILGALATAAAVIVAVSGIAHERGVAREASKRAKAAESRLTDERAAADSARSHAQAVDRWERRRGLGLQVVGWVEEQRALGRDRSITDRLNSRVGVGVNHSAMPVFDFSLHVRHRETPVDDVITVAQKRVLPPGDRLAEHLPESHQNGDVQAFVYFRDITGVFWRRDDDGKLYELDSNGHPLADQAPPQAPARPTAGADSTR